MYIYIYIYIYIISNWYHVGNKRKNSFTSALSNKKRWKYLLKLIKPLKNYNACLYSAYVRTNMFKIKKSPASSQYYYYVHNYLWYDSKIIADSKLLVLISTVLYEYAWSSSSILYYHNHNRRSTKHYIYTTITITIIYTQVISLIYY